MERAKTPRIKPILRALVLTLGGLGLLLGVIVLGQKNNAPPSRCADGMVALGTRCCGEGQTLQNTACIGKPKRCAKGLVVTDEGCLAAPRVINIAEGKLRIGPSDWEAEGQVKPQEVQIPAFAIDAYEVTEARYAKCVAEAACPPLTSSSEPGRAIANITLHEAITFCKWAGGTLPTPEQLAFVAAGPQGRRYAWGDTGAVCRRAAWGLTKGPCGEGATAPEITGSHPDGISPEGLHDLAGNVAEWATTTNPNLAEARGGSYADAAASALRSWNRRELNPNTRSPEIGFRCVYR